MKYTLILILAGLLIWTAVMVQRIPTHSVQGEVVLTWTTDPNPQRIPQAERFSEMYPGYRLRIDPDNTDVMKVIVQSSAGMGPDIIDRINDLNFQTYLDAGILWDITEQARAMGFGPETLHPAVRPLVMARDPETLEYRQYLYPCNVSAQILFYNKDLFDAHGVPYPPEDPTWADYIDRAKRLTIFPEGRGAPDLFGGGGVQPLHCIWSRGGDVLNADGTRALLAEPEAVAGMQFLHDLYFKYGVEPTPTELAGVVSQGGWASTAFWSWFSEGRVAMYIGSRWNVIQFRRHFAELRAAQDRWETDHPGEPYRGRGPPRIGASLIPRAENGPRFTLFGARCAGINKMSPHREEALFFLQYLAGKPYAELINEGGDNLPGNHQYAVLEDLVNPDWPDEEAIHRMSLKALADGKTIAQSLFIGQAQIHRHLNQVRQEITASPDLTPEAIAHIMQRVTDRMDQDIARNIERTPHLRATYNRLLAEGAEPITLHAELGP